MTAHRRDFRFGVVATPQGGGAAWQATAHRVEQLGYSTLLMPDGLQLLSPLPSLALAAGVTGMRIGTFVLAAPMRPPQSTAWEAHSLSVLTDGRFELGIGTGLPTVQQATQRFGLPYGSAGQRLLQVAETIDHVRELDGTDRYTPVLMAAGGPKARELAAAKADIVTFAAGPLASRDEISAMVADLRAHAGRRADDIELASNLFVVGDEVPPQAARYVGADAAALLAADSLTMLRGSVADMVDELRRRRDLLGTSYVTVSAAFSEELAPVVERLTGR